MSRDSLSPDKRRMYAEAYVETAERVHGDVSPEEMLTKSKEMLTDEVGETQVSVVKTYAESFVYNLNTDTPDFTDEKVMSGYLLDALANKTTGTSPSELSGEDAPETRGFY